jgi:hypothetical protein
MKYLVNLMLWRLGQNWLMLTEQIHYLRREIKKLELEKHLRMVRIARETTDHWLVGWRVEKEIMPIATRIRQLVNRVDTLEDERRAIRMSRIEWQHCKPVCPSSAPAKA